MEYIQKWLYSHFCIIPVIKIGILYLVIYIISTNLLISVNLGSVYGLLISESVIFQLGYKLGT